MSKYIIEAKDVSYTYQDGTKALDSVHMNIERGKKVAVIGANGAGKSTLFLHFNGINKPQGGELYFNGKKIDYTNNELMKLRKEVGIVFQEPDSQLFSSSVLQEISFGPMNMKLEREQVMKKVEAAMEATAIAELKHKPTHFLSYGQKKRVAIASILAMEPSVIILDEPTSGLDPQNADVVLEILNKLNKTGRTIVISTHDIDMAYTWADYIYVMNKSKVMGHGKPEEVFTNVELMAAACIKLPWIVEVYNGINHRNKANCSILPKSKEELMKFINTLGSMK
ncbi:MAG: cobalt transport protein ATP-binding subunit [Clostridia bacterium]|jgi:cobalt/nickel transport system ATP-binding protein|nr:cobalt transport protein ATP-binding subunit [Clostridia bacterium]